MKNPERKNIKFSSQTKMNRIFIKTILMIFLMLLNVNVLLHTDWELEARVDLCN